MSCFIFRSYDFIFYSIDYYIPYYLSNKRKIEDSNSFRDSLSKLFMRLAYFDLINY